MTYKISQLTAASAGNLTAAAAIETTDSLVASVKVTYAQLRTALLGTAFTATDDLAIRAITASNATALLASAPLLNASQTWNAGAVVFTAAKINVTDTASAAGSLLQDWQVGGVSKFKVDKAGALTIGSLFILTSPTITTGMQSTNANSPVFSQIAAKQWCMGVGGGETIRFFCDLGAYIDFPNYSGGHYRVAGIQVVNARKTGWAVATGTATRTTFDTTTVTLAVLAEHVKALIDDLHGTAGHGLIGT